MNRFLIKSFILFARPATLRPLATLKPNLFTQYPNYMFGSSKQGNNPGGYDNKDNKQH